MNNTSAFCNLVRQRTEENKSAVALLSRAGLTGQVVSVLRQELDSMVRVLFLLRQPLSERDHLIEQTLNGQKWRLSNNALVTDRQMVDLANSLNGWAQSVYKIGCAFIHLSSYHDYILRDPFLYLNQQDASSIKGHLNNYHGFPMGTNLSMETIAPYLPMVFDKISSNSEYYIRGLETQSTNFDF